MPDADIVVSVVIPVYNVECYLRECLDSVITQTLLEIEILCVNDGSTDGSLAILEEYAAKDSRIGIIDQPNGGLSAARNAGFARAHGKYVYFLDSDDSIDPDLCRMASIAADYHQADVLFFDYISYDERFGLDRKKKTVEPRYTRYPPDRDSLFYLYGVWIKLFRCDFLRENNLLFLEVIRRNEDVDFHWRLLLAAPKIATLPAHLLFYRNRRDSISHQKNVRKVFVIDTFNVIRQELIRWNLWNRYEKEYTRQKLHVYYFSGYLQISRHLRQDFCRQIMKSLTPHDWDYVAHRGPMEKESRLFYRSLRGGLMARWRFFFHWWFMKIPQEFLSALGVGVWKDRIIHRMAQRFSERHITINRSLCREIVGLQEEIVAYKKMNDLPTMPMSDTLKHDSHS